MSGLRSSSGDKPYELKDEIRRPVGLGICARSFVQVMLTGPPANRVSMSSPSSLLIVTTGMVRGGAPATGRKPGASHART